MSRNGPSFVTGRARNGQHTRQTPRNVQARLNTVVKAANKKLKNAGIDAIGNVSPHSLRRTYASLRAALRDDPIYIAEQMGHKDARFTFSVYQRAAKRREKLSGRVLLKPSTRPLIGHEWAQKAIQAMCCTPRVIRCRPRRPNRRAAEVRHMRL